MTEPTKEQVEAIRIWLKNVEHGPSLLSQPFQVKQWEHDTCGDGVVHVRSLLAALDAANINHGYGPRQLAMHYDDIRAKLDEANARIRELEELLGSVTEAAAFVEKVREFRKADDQDDPVVGGVCTYCKMPFTTMGPLKEHVLACEDNPLVQRIAELEE